MNTHDYAVLALAAFAGHHARTILNVVTGMLVAAREYFIPKTPPGPQERGSA